MPGPRKGRRQDSRHLPPAGASTGRPPRATWISGPTYWGGLALLLAAVFLAALLAIQHFGSGLPGCGPQSGCEALEKTTWGRFPGTRWPTSFLGLAYFSAMLTGWAVAARRIPAMAMWLVRGGGAISLMYAAVMLALRKFCPYCVAVHISNLAFLLLLERGMRRPSRATSAGGQSMSGGHMRRIAGAVAIAFVLVSTGLGVANARFEEKERTRAETERRASTDKIVEASQAPDTSRLVDLWGSAGFTGRYRLGPEASPIRVVMLTDYQCPDCKRLEGEIEEVLSSHPEISLSIKHFPMCMEATPGVPCNQYAKQTLHPNACWAARAAETAGILKGDAGFWEMHRWLFQIEGSFTSAVLNKALEEFGYDPKTFVTVMSSPETLRRVHADVEEGKALGLFYTPMIFVNAIEFKGWQIRGALRRTIEEVAAKNPPALKATADRPMLAAQKYVDDWRDQPTRVMPIDTHPWSMGAASGDARSGASSITDVVLFGDYQEPHTAEMDSAIRDFVKGKSNIRYSFRHYPIDPSCNSALPKEVRSEAIHPLACRASKAAEAAGAIRGASAYWKMHDWLMKNQKSFSDETLRAAAGSIGLDANTLFAEMEKPEVASAVLEDALAGKQLGLTSVPMVFINAKWVPRTMRDEENVVLRILESARAR